MASSVRLTRKARPARGVGAGRRRLRAAAFGLTAMVGATAGPAAGQSGDLGRLLRDGERKAAQAGQIGIVTGPPGGTYAQIARDLAILLDTRSAAADLGKGLAPLRIVPVIGRGSACNVEDLLNLRGVDAALVQHDVLAGMRRNPAYAGIDERIRYITTLYREELHVLARDGRATLSDLAGRTVATGEACSGSELTAANLFALAGIDAKRVRMPQERALRALLSGEIDALVAVGGKPMRLFREIARSDVAAQRIGFVDLSPQADLLGGYEAGRLTPHDYPEIIGTAGSVGTRAVRAVLAVYDWAPSAERFRSTAAFARALFANLDRLQDPASGFLDKWRDVDLDRELVGWRRFSVSPSLVRGERAADDVLVLSPACREAFHAALRRGGQEPSEMPLSAYAAGRADFRRSGSPACP